MPCLTLVYPPPPDVIKQTLRLFYSRIQLLKLKLITIKQFKSVFKIKTGTLDLNIAGKIKIKSTLKKKNLHKFDLCVCVCVCV